MSAFELFIALLQLLSLIFIFTFHNYARAYAAYKLGDDTPKRAGFLTINPLPHIDPIGTVLLPGIFILLKSPLLIGWPRMVPIDYNRFKDHRFAAIVIALVGIFTYFAIAAISIAAIKLLEVIHPPSNVFIPLDFFFKTVALISAFFGFLNLFPIPPLDMGVILFLLMGKNMHEIQGYSLIGGFIILILFISGFFSHFFTPIFAFLERLM